MASRGIWSLMSAGTRRSLTLAWTALFVLSLLMQYGALANPSSALAVHDTGTFELDGDADNDAVTGDDWGNVFGPGASSEFASIFVDDAINSTPDELLFTGGNSKDIDRIEDWRWTTGPGVQDKNDIADAFAAAYTVAGDLIVYFGLDRYASNGDAQTGFWFLRNGFGRNPDGTFAGSHQVGDLLVQIDFQNGGTSPILRVYEWVGSGGDTGSAGTLDLVEAVSSCLTTPVGDDQCAVANTSVQVSPWSFDPKSGPDDQFPAGSFVEGGINLTDLRLDQGCFASFIAETRSSQSPTATLSDFAFGNFALCETPTLTTQVSGSSIVIGAGSVTDTAHLSGTKGVPFGTVDFFLCGPTGAAADCTTGGTDAGQDTVVDGNGDATSNAMSPAAPGWYCFRAEYTPAAGLKYLPTSHTNSTTECFQVLKASPAIVTTANETIIAGGQISDTAVLSGGYNPTGTITFTAYRPGDATCTGQPAFQTTVPVDHGNGSYGPVSFTPQLGGTYRWIAAYSGDANNNAVAGACNADGEVDLVQRATPTIATQASASVEVGGVISDTATVSGGFIPTGTVTFTLYGPDNATCAGSPIFTDTKPLVAGQATSAGFTTSAAGTYRWIASYSGDANNVPVAGACNAANENVVVTKKSPTIATLLSGGGQTGTSITVPLGTAVTDSSTLSGATADAGGTVTYTVFSDSDCETFVFDAGTKTVANGVVPNSNSFTVSLAGTYYWQADYSGDAKNNAASSACNLEIVTVPKNIPQLVTSADESVVIGNAIHDSASLTGGFAPTGSITFKAWANETCSGSPVFETSVTVIGNATYGPVSFTPAAPGVYHWIAAYSGDANNAAVSGGCGDPGENDTVRKASPTIATQASGSVVVGGAISDTATVSGGYSPTGLVTFTLYGPDNATCSGTPIFTDTALLAQNGTATSDPFTTTMAGTYRWIASYEGDANNNAVAGSCNEPNENVVVTKASPTIATQASASVTVGGVISDTATVSGGYSPSGNVTFTLFGPDNATCSGTPIFSDTKPLVAGQATSAGYTTTAAGTYRWIASYAGDANNNAVSGACNAANENVVVTKAQPEIATQATEGGQQGDLISDIATVTGGYSPTGTVTFWLFDSDDSLCEDDPIFTSTVALVAGTATSGTFAAPGAGTFHWIARYNGDSNNEPVQGSCGDEGETTVIRQFSPDITTTLHSGQLSGASISVLFGSSVYDTATLTGAGPTAGGNVEYTVYSDDACESVYADAGTKSVTNGVVGASDAVVFDTPGTYYWQAHYSGDLNNAPATSDCTDEVLTVTTPDLHAVKLVRTNDGAYGPTSTAQPGDTLTFQITVTNSGDADATNVPVTDDINDVLAHSTFVSCSDGCANVAGVLSWTIPSIAANGGSEVVTFSVALDDSFPEGQTVLPNVVVVVGPGSNCPESEGDEDCDTTTTVEAAPDLHAVKLVGTNEGEPGPTSTAEPGDELTFYITVTNSGDADATDVEVTDDINDVLAHATFVSCSDGCSNVAGVLSWTISSIAANGGSETLTFTVELDAEFPVGVTELPNVVVVEGPGSNCPEDEGDEDCDTTTTVNQPALTILKDVSGYTGGTAINGTPIAKVGDTLTYTLTYDITSPPAHNAEIIDTLPLGVAYVSDSASSNAEFTFLTFNAATRTLTWTAPVVTADGSLTFRVTVLASAPTVGTLVNTATIESDETPLDDDDATVLVQAVQAITAPPTDTYETEMQAPSSNPGFALMLVLLALAGLMLTVGSATPVPQRARRRTEGRRR